MERENILGRMITGIPGVQFGNFDLILVVPKHLSFDCVFKGSIIYFYMIFTFPSVDEP